MLKIYLQNRFLCYNKNMEKIKLTNDMQLIFNTFSKHGYECFIVGGCVRDFFLGKTPNDIDFATNATPNEIKKCFKGFTLLDTGLKHGTLTLLIDHTPYEITTYRTESEYFDHRHPSTVKYVKSITEDLARRDFTINAIAYHPELGIVDPFGGLADLDNKIIRCVNNPINRFTEDALRILRGLRFSSTLGYEIEPATRTACFECAGLIKMLSAERICAELFKTLAGTNAHNIIFDYIDIWGVAIPELLKMKDFQQHNPHHIYDVLKHTCVALEHSDEDLIIRLAVLFHDIGKPDCFSLDEKGNGHFYKHATKSVEITRDILSRLKVDNDTKTKVLTLIKYHDLDLRPTEKYVRRLCYKLGSIDAVKDLIKVQRADNKGQAPIHDERIAKFDEIDKILLQLEQSTLSFSLKDLDINGNDLIELGYKGPQIGDALKFLLDAVLNEEVKNHNSDLIDFLNTRSK